MVTAIGFCGGWKIGQLGIQLVTFSGDAHCFALLNDGKRVIDATAKHGVAERDLNDLEYDWIHFIELAPISTKVQRSVFEDFLRAEIGKPYDFGFTLGYPYLGRNWQDDDAWACSELLGDKAVKSFILTHPGKIHRLTPRNLCRRLGAL